MSDGTITYDYDVLEQCVSMMKSKAEEIQNQTDELVGQVKTIMVDWKGATADAYNNLANDLAKDLAANKQNLENLRAALSDGAGGMQYTDSRGAKVF